MFENIVILGNRIYHITNILKNLSSTYTEISFWLLPPVRTGTKLYLALKNLHFKLCLWTHIWSWYKEKTSHFNQLLMELKLAYSTQQWTWSQIYRTNKFFRRVTQVLQNYQMRKDSEFYRIVHALSWKHNKHYKQCDYTKINDP